MSNRKILLPFYLSIALALGVSIGLSVPNDTMITRVIQRSGGNAAYLKLREVVELIDDSYVDKIEEEVLVQTAIDGMIKDLDPHTVYIPKKEFTQTVEVMNGNFEGIGIEFFIMSDTILVVSPIQGGPSARLGIMAGDKIITVDDSTIAGIGIQNKDVVKLLRGPKGSEVTLGIQRDGESELLDFTIVRDQIPIHSVDANFMVDDEIAYLKVNRFSQTTFEEFTEALTRLKKEGMQKLVLDLRGNSGGYLVIAVHMIDQILDGKKLIVYTEGRKVSRKEYRAEYPGVFEEGDLVVLVDEGSASASEILAGAVQDWDRGTIIGRRTFGKGLVQNQHMFSDSSAMRLTVAKYFTPLGRSIQKPYSEGRDEYNDEIYERYYHGEYTDKDSMKINDSLSFITPGGKIVYGGGGIIPDVFVSIDTTGSTQFYRRIIRKGILNQFAYYYYDKYRSEFEGFNDVMTFKDDFKFHKKFRTEFIQFSNKKGVPFNIAEYEESEDRIQLVIKANLAQQKWRTNGYFVVISEIDNTFKKGLEVLRSSRP